MEVFVSVLLVVVIVLVLGWIRQNRGLPPGPGGIPGLSGIKLMASDKIPTRTFRKLRKKYGDIFSIQVGSQLLVVLNGYDVIKDALVKRADEFSDRPNNTANRILAKGRGLLASSGEHWKQTRTFSLTALRELGFGKKSLETKIMEEVDVFLDVVGQQKGKPFDISPLAHSSVSNIICSIVFGQRFNYDDKDFKWLLSRVDLQGASPTGVVSTFPVLRFLPGDLFGINRFLKNIGDLRDYFQTSVNVHKQMFDPNASQDLIDLFIKEKPKHDKDNSVFRYDNLDFIILHLFLAGTETTSTTIRWFIVYLLRNPDVQARLFKEIESVVGMSRAPTIADRPSLNYFDAVITEVLRIANIVPLSVPHGARKDIYFRGYRIPKNATILPNLDSILSDPELFPNPEVFDPTRFLDNKGKFCGAEKVVAFSLGRRVCLGEALARMEMFLFLTSLVQRYEILPDDPDSLPSKEGIFGITYGPYPYKFRAVARV